MLYFTKMGGLEKDRGFILFHVDDFMYSLNNLKDYFLLLFFFNFDGFSPKISSAN